MNRKADPYHYTVPEQESRHSEACTDQTQESCLSDESAAGSMSVPAKAHGKQLSRREKLRDTLWDILGELVLGSLELLIEFLVDLIS